MKRLFVLFVAMIVLVSGCAMYTPSREFAPDNTFACNMPNVKVQLSSEFVYAGVYDKRFLGKSTTDPLVAQSNVVNEYFVWQNKDKSKLVSIKISTIKDPGFYFNHTGTRGYETVILGGDKWYAKKFDRWSFKDNHLKKLKAIDPTITKKYAVAKRYARIGINSNMMVGIMYVSKDSENFTPETDITILK